MLPNEILAHIFTLGCQLPIDSAPFNSFRDSNLFEGLVYNTVAIRPSHRSPKDFTKLVTAICSRWNDVANSVPHLYFAKASLVCSITYEALCRANGPSLAVKYLQADTPNLAGMRS